MVFTKSSWATLAGIGILGLGAVWATLGVKRAAERAETTLTELGRDPRRELHVELARVPAPTRARAIEPARSADETGSDTLASAPVDGMGLPESLARGFDSAFVYTGERNMNPLSDGYPGAPGASASRASEAEMRAKEELLLEHYPGLREKVEESRAARKQATQLYEQRGNRNPHEWELSQIAEREQ